MVDATRRLSPEYLDALVERSTDNLLDRIERWATQLLDDNGLTFGEIPLPPEDVIARTIADHHSGLLLGMRDDRATRSEYNRERRDFRAAVKRFEEE